MVTDQWDTEWANYLLPAHWRVTSPWRATSDSTSNAPSAHTPFKRLNQEAQSFDRRLHGKYFTGTHRHAHWGTLTTGRLEGVLLEQLLNASFKGFVGNESRMCWVKEGHDLVNFLKESDISAYLKLIDTTGRFHGIFHMRRLLSYQTFGKGSGAPQQQRGSCRCLLGVIKWQLSPHDNYQASEASSSRNELETILGEYETALT